MVVKIANCIGALLITACAALSLLSLPAAIGDYVREPEDVWLLLGYLLIALPLAWLCVANVRKPPQPKRRQSRQMKANLAAALLLSALVAVGSSDSVITMIGGVFVLGPAVWLSAFVMRQ